LIIKEDLSKFKEAVLFFNFEYTQKIQRPISLLFELNGKKQEIEINPVQATSFYQVYFSPCDLRQGKNIVIIKPKMIFDSTLKIAIDSMYCFGRSHFANKNGEWERLKNGEYMVELLLSPKRSVAGHINQGIFFYKNKMYDESISEFQQALDKNPNYVNTHYNFGVVYEKMGRLDDAIKEYKKVIELETDKEMLIKIRNDLVRIYYTKGMLEEILKESEEILILDPNNIDAHNNTGSAYYIKGMLDEASSEFQRGLELDPNNAYAQQMIEECKKKIVDKN
jgi:tetratricopeptide (TPR) repeat protein